MPTNPLQPFGFPPEPSEVVPQSNSTALVWHVPYIATEDRNTSHVVLIHAVFLTKELLEDLDSFSGRNIMLCNAASDIRWYNIRH